MYCTSRQTGVYIIRCHINNFIYVGSAASHKGFRGRLRFHLWQLRTGRHHSPILQNHFNKYGENAFNFEIALVCPPDRCTDFEQAFIDAVGVGYKNKSYNINPSVQSYHLGAKRSGINKNIGRVVSEETRRKLSEANKGKIVSPETRAKFSAMNKGRKMSPEAIAKIRASSTGRKHSPETVEKLRQRMLENPFPAETLQRIREKVAQANSKDFVVATPEGEEIAIRNLKALDFPIIGVLP